MRVDDRVTSPEPDVVERLDPTDDFNFRHFRMRHMVAELIRSWRGTGVRPGQEAPDFTLLTTDGTELRLSDLRGRPVLLHLVSYTCPVTRGSVTPMRQLHEEYGDRVTFVDVVVRQAHPGERHDRYRSFAAKLADARDYRREEGIAWPVAVDDLSGTVQRAYGGLAASIYVLDQRGRVAYYALWGQSPRLTDALDGLVNAPEGAPTWRTLDRRPHLAAAIVTGQRGPVRGGRRSLVDLELGFPGATLLMTGGWLLRPVLRPVVERTTPTPVPVRLALTLAAAAVLTPVGRRLVARDRVSRGRARPAPACAAAP